MVRSGSYAMKIAALFLLLIAAPLIPGCSPSDSPLETIVLGEQVTAEDDGTSIEDPSSPVQLSPTIDNITVVGSLIQGQPSVIGLSCTIDDVDGMVQSVRADFSAAGGPGDVMLSKSSGKLWVWSGVITATVAGSAMVYFTATDDSAPVATQDKSVFVAASTQSDPADPADPSTGTPDAPANPPVVAAGQEGENIALGRPYAWSMAPNHSACTDAGDAIQLTDGHRTTSSTPAIDASVVGWTLHPQAHSWVAITIDVGQVQPIKGVQFSAIAGSYFNVDWPGAIPVLTSDDGVRYYPAGELVRLSAEQGLPAHGLHASHAYRTELLATHGRYVQFVVASHPHILVDEIEVYRGNDSLLTAPLASSPIVDMLAHIQQCQLQAGVARRLVLDAQSVRSQVGNCAYLPPTEREQLVAELTAIIGAAVQLPPVDAASFKAVLPVNGLHARVFSIQARLWNALGRSGLTAWQRPTWDPLGPTEVPGTDPAAVSITLMQDEYRAGAFHLSNAGDSDLTVHVNIQGLPGGMNPSYVTVHEVAWTDTWRGVPAASALPEATRSADGFLIRIPSGMTRQAWLTVHAVGVAAGTHSGTVLVNAGSAGTITIPLQLRVSTVRFPSRPTLSLGGWDFTDGDHWLGVTPANQPALISLLREHYVDTPWAAGWRVMPNPVSFQGFDAWVARWPDARGYCIALAVGREFEGHPMGTNGFDKAVGKWISAYAQHWRDDLHLDLNQIALQISDEPQTLEQVSKIKAWARAIKAAVPEVRIWENPSYTCPADTEMFDLVDVFCVERSFYVKHDVYRNTYRSLAAQPGKTLQFYTCWGPAGGLDPYSYYRLQAWNCWTEGATAMFFWSFADSGGTSCWNEYLSTKRNYTPLFVDATTVTGTKQMQAIREGVADVEYLVMLKKRIVEMENAGDATPLLSQAKALLDQSPVAVLDAPGVARYFWTDTKDRGIADQVRVEVLSMLEALQ
jgi:hypothetical protein